MPNKARVIQKEWWVMTRPYIEYNNSAVVMGTVTAKHPCQNPNQDCTQYGTIVKGNDAWVVYKKAYSFSEIRYAVRELLYEVGLKKEHIKIVEAIDHDYIVTPLT